MKIKKTVLWFITLLLILLPGLAGCSNRTADSQQNNAPVVNSEEASTNTVTDCAGRQVKIPSKVNRIACLYAFSGHVAAMLGKGDNIVAVVDGLKRDKLLTQMYPSIKNAAVPSVEGAINIEELINTNPDVVFVKSDTAKTAGEAAKLDKSGIPYVVTDYRNIKEQQYAIDVIGKVIGAEEKARKYNEYYNKCVDLVKQKTAAIPREKRVRIYHSVNEATRTDTKDTLPADWIQAIGAINVSLDQNLRMLEGKHFAGLEQILLWDPDVILANEPGVADYIMTNKQWSSLSAVKNRKVYQMPNGISRWGHPGSLETPLAVLWTAKILYPDLFNDLNMESETKSFYKEFFNLSLSNDTVSQILSGMGMRISKQEGQR